MKVNAPFPPSSGDMKLRLWSRYSTEMNTVSFTWVFGKPDNQLHHCMLNLRTCLWQVFIEMLSSA